jgi:hypothetical protein
MLNWFKKRAYPQLFKLRVQQFGVNEWNHLIFSIVPDVARTEVHVEFEVDFFDGTYEKIVLDQNNVIKRASMKFDNKSFGDVSKIWLTIRAHVPRYCIFNVEEKDRQARDVGFMMFVYMTFAQNNTNEEQYTAQFFPRLAHVLSKTPWIVKRHIANSNSASQTLNSSASKNKNKTKIAKDLEACSTNSCHFVRDTNGNPSKLRPYFAYLSKQFLQGQRSDIHEATATIVSHFMQEARNALMFNMGLAGIYDVDGRYVVYLPNTNKEAHAQTLKTDLDDLMMTGGKQSRKRRTHKK